MVLLTPNSKSKLHYPNYQTDFENTHTKKITESSINSNYKMLRIGKTKKKSLDYNINQITYLQKLLLNTKKI